MRPRRLSAERGFPRCAHEQSWSPDPVRIHNAPRERTAARLDADGDRQSGRTPVLQSTPEEWSAVVFEGTVLRMRGQANVVVEHTANLTGAFTVRDLADAVAETER